jgi:hypothetical protein
VHRHSLASFVAALVIAIPAEVAAQVSPGGAIVFDSYMTPAAGAEDVVSVQQFLASLEDRTLPLKLGQERSKPGLALGIFYRSVKLLGLDVPQDHMLMVVAHEVFGHGSRLRELGNGRIRYGFDAPIPYGEGGAVTRFNGELPATPLARLTIETSGIEAQHAVADAIVRRAVARGRIHYREAWLYFESRLTAMTYILTASAHSAEGHDVADFLETFRDACKAPACRPITKRDVQRAALVTLADPLLYYSLYGFSAVYIGSGKTLSPIPMIPLGDDWRYLPALGFQLTPYGREYVIRNVLLKGTTQNGQGARATGITLRIGTTGASTTWALDLHMPDVRLPWTRLRVAPEAALWRQPYILADETSAPLETGFALMGTTILTLPTRLNSEWSRGLYVTAGYKSIGFLPGEQLSGGGVLRAGITFGH